MGSKKKLKDNSVGIKIRRIALLGENDDIVLTEEQERLVICRKEIYSKNLDNVLLIERNEKATAFIYYDEKTMEFINAKVTVSVLLSNWHGDRKNHIEDIIMGEDEFDEHFVVVPVGYL